MLPVQMILRPGDVLLYRPKGLFGRIIQFKTWHKTGHVEVYVGDGMSVASRDGKGVGRYPLRVPQLYRICRPKVPLDLERSLEWFATVEGQPYGWLDLLTFAGLNLDGKGMVCSPFVADFLRAGGINPFNGEPSIKIAPFQFDVSNSFDDLDVIDGLVDGKAIIALSRTRLGRLP